MMAAGPFGSLFSASSRIGEILDGKYRIDKHLGAGGTGNVYLATHLGTTTRRRSKSLLPGGRRNRSFWPAFSAKHRPAAACAIRISFNVTDFGIAKTAGGDMPYLIMEFLDGQTLSDFQKATAPAADDR
jgi:serine/threonine-protein kinase